jgi:hypothetical protein
MLMLMINQAMIKAGTSLKYNRFAQLRPLKSVSRKRFANIIDKQGRGAITPFPSCAQVAELVDALASGASDRKVVGVRVPSWAPFHDSLSFALIQK